jgi:hypothetical protein
VTAFGSAFWFSVSELNNWLLFDFCKYYTKLVLRTVHGYTWGCVLLHSKLYYDTIVVQLGDQNYAVFVLISVC